VRFRVRRQDAVRVLALHGQRRARAVDVASLERDPLLGSQPRLGADDRDRPVCLAELHDECVDLLGLERAKLLGSRLRVAAGLDGRFVDVVPSHRGAERCLKPVRR
jgi:hypothetical protein